MRFTSVMRKLVFALALSIGLVAINKTSAQTRFHLSQYMRYQPYFNPAAISGFNGVNGALIHRTQWVGISGAPQVTALGISGPINQKNHAVGLNLFRDQIGVNSSIWATGQYSYKAKLSRDNYLAFGLNASLGFNQSKLADVLVNDGGDGVFSNNTGTVTQSNFGVGTYYFRPKFYLGFAIPQLLKNSIEYSGTYNGKTEFDSKNLHYHLHAGYGFELNRSLDLNTSTLLKAVYGAPLQIDINAQIKYDDKIGFGLSFRTSKDIIGMISFDAAKAFKIGYAYDYNFGNLGLYNSGTHEIMIGFNLYQPKKGVIIDIPRF